MGPDSEGAAAGCYPLTTFLASGSLLKGNLSAPLPWLPHKAQSRSYWPCSWQSSSNVLKVEKILSRNMNELEVGNEIFWGLFPYYQVPGNGENRTHPAFTSYLLSEERL